MFYYFLFLLIVLFQSCNNSKNKKNVENIPVLSLNNFSKEAIFSLDDLIDSVQFIALETNEENLIGEISKLVFKNDTIYVFDKKHTKSLYVFNIKGDFLYKISRLGKGPGEYVEFIDFIISDQFIEIYDSKQGKIIYYDKNGQFNHELDVGFLGVSLYKLNNNNYLFNTEGYRTEYNKRNKYGLLNVDQKGDLIKKLYSHEADYDNQFTFQKKNVFHDDNLFIPNFSEFIYKIEDNEITELYKINRGKFDFDLSKLTDEIMIEGKANSIYNIDNLFKIDNYLLVDFIFQHRTAFALYDINSLKLIRSGVGLITTPKTNGFSYYPKAVYKNRVVSILDEVEVRSVLERTDLSQVEFLKKYKDMPYFNPVLMFYNLK